MEVLGLIIYFTMASVCLKVIWYYDDDLQSQAIELKGEFASFLAATLQALRRAEGAIAELQTIVDRLAHEMCQSRAKDALRLISRIDRWERCSQGFPHTAKEEISQLAQLLFLPESSTGLLQVHAGDDITEKSEQIADVCCASWRKRLHDFQAKSAQLQRNPVKLSEHQIDKGIAIVAVFRPDGQEEVDPHINVGGT